MANYKNNKPKPYKGCCGMCACKDHRGGLRNKRMLTLAEERHVVGHDEDLQLAEDPRSPIIFIDDVFEPTIRQLVTDMVYGDMAPYPIPRSVPLRMPLGAVAVYRRAA